MHTTVSFPASDAAFSPPSLRVLSLRYPQSWVGTCNPLVAATQRAVGGRLAELGIIRDDPSAQRFARLAAGSYGRRPYPHAEQEELFTFTASLTWWFFYNDLAEGVAERHIPGRRRPRRAARPPPAGPSRARNLGAGPALPSPHGRALAQSARGSLRSPAARTAGRGSARRAVSRRAHRASWAVRAAAAARHRQRSRRAQDQRTADRLLKRRDLPSRAGSDIRSTCAVVTAGRHPRPLRRLSSGRRDL